MSKPEDNVIEVDETRHQIELAIQDIVRNPQSPNREEAALALQRLPWKPDRSLKAALAEYKAGKLGAQALVTAVLEVPADPYATSPVDPHTQGQPAADPYAGAARRLKKEGE